MRYLLGASHETGETREISDRVGEFRTLLDSKKACPAATGAQAIDGLPVK